MIYALVLAYTATVCVVLTAMALADALRPKDHR